MDDIERQLHAGGLPPEFLERFEIVPTNDPLAIQFSQKTQSIIQRLLGDSFDPQKHTFRILLSMNNGPNAFVYSHADPPVMVFTKDILTIMKTEDDHAAITAHELTHKRLAERLGLHINSKFEELGGDVYGACLLQNAGYIPRAMPVMMNKLSKFDRSKVPDYLDVHPVDRNRIRVLRNFITSMNEGILPDGIVVRLPENKKPTAFDRDLKNNIKQHTQLRYMELLLQNKAFEKANNTGKIEIIREILEKEALNPDDKYKFMRFRDLFYALQSIDLDPKNAEEIKAFEKLADYVTRFNRESRPFWKRTVEKLYPLMIQNWRKADLAGAPGFVGKLAVQMKHFINAATPREARNAAIKIRVLQEQIETDIKPEFSDYPNLYDSLKLFPHFEKPARDHIQQVDDTNSTLPDQRQWQGLKFPWENHLCWANDERTNRSKPHINVALSFLGVHHYGGESIAHDQELLEDKKLSSDRYTSYFNHGYTSSLVIDPFKTRTTDANYSYDDLVVRDRREILGFIKSQRFWPGRDAQPTPQLLTQFQNSETQWIARKNQDAAAMVDAVDWSLWDNLGWVDTFDRLSAETNGDIALLRDELDQFDWFNPSWGHYGRTPEREYVEELEISARHSRRNEFFNTSVNGTRAGDLLNPLISIIETHNPFQTRFVEKMREKVREEPHLFRPMMRQFFNNITTGYIRDLPKLGLGTTIKSMIEDQTNEVNRDNSIIQLFDRDIIGLELGISINHPYMDLVLDPAVGLTPEDRIDFLSLTRFGKAGDYPDPYQKWNFDPFIAMGQGHIDTPDKLRWLVELGRSEVGWESYVERTDTLNFRSERRRKHFVSEYIGTAVYDACMDPQKIFSRDELVALDRCTFASILSRTYPLIRENFNAVAARSLRHELSQTKSVPSLTESFACYSHYGVFANLPELRKDFERAISEGIDHLPLHEQKEVAEKLLFSRKINTTLIGEANYEANLVDPDFRQKIISTYCNSLVGLHGIDDQIESSAFESDTTDLINTVIKQTKGTYRFGILSELADKMVMRRSLSYYIKDQIVDSACEYLDKSTSNKFGVGELSVDSINSDSDFRLANIRFLRSPLTRDSALLYIEAAKKANKLDSILSKTNQQIANALRAYGSIVTEELQIEAVSLAHRNFWSQNLGLRTASFDAIMFPTDNKYTSPTVGLYTFEENKELVLDEVLPDRHEKQPEPSGIRKLLRLKPKEPPSRTVIANDLFNAILNGGTQDEQRLLLSAAMVAQEPSADKSQQNIISGKSLKKILYAKGPGGVKIAQALQNRPETPADIRKELEDSTVNADRPFRWTVHELLDKTGYYENVKRNQILGCGAYGITVGVEYPNGNESAVTLLRNNAQYRAEKEFSTLSKAIRSLIGKYRFLDPMKSMVDQARNMSRIETNMNLAKRQHNFARRLYHRAIRVDGFLFNFDTAPWVRHGNKFNEKDPERLDYAFKETRIMPGVHFSELPENTNRQKAYKIAAAKSTFYLEQVRIASGKPFDHDRHIGQSRFSEENVGLFDHGAMALKAPTDRQKELMGRVIGNALYSHASSKISSKALSYMRRERPIISVKEALLQELDKPQKSDEDTIFLAELKRGFLAQAKFMEAIKSSDQVENLFAAAWTSPEVHRLVKRGMFRSLGPLYWKVMGEMKKLGQKAEIEVIERETLPLMHKKEAPRKVVPIMSSRKAKEEEPASRQADKDHTHPTIPRKIARGFRSYTSLENAFSLPNIISQAARMPSPNDDPPTGGGGPHRRHKSGSHSRSPRGMHLKM